MDDQTTVQPLGSRVEPYKTGLTPVISAFQHLQQRGLDHIHENHYVKRAVIKSMAKRPCF